MESRGERILRSKIKKNKPGPKKGFNKIVKEVYDGFVYFAGFSLSTEMRFIKIGFAKNVQRRLDALSVPAPLYLIGAIPGNLKLEKSIHDRLTVHRQHREWFIDNQDVRNYINSLLKIKRAVPENYICIAFTEQGIIMKFMIGATVEEMEAIKLFSDSAYFIKSNRSLFHELLSNHGADPIDPIRNKYEFSEAIEEFLKKHTSYPE